LRHHDLRMGLCAVAAFLPVVLTAAYGITLENGVHQEAPMLAAEALPPVAPVALAQPPVTLAALPVALATDPPSLAIPVVASSPAHHEAHAGPHHPKKRPPHHVG